MTVKNQPDAVSNLRMRRNKWSLCGWVCAALCLYNNCTVSHLMKRRWRSNVYY